MCVSVRITEISVLMCRFALAEILLRLFIEGLLATQRAEIIGLAFILGCASRSGRINVHAADGIMYCSCHRFSPFLLIMFVKYRRDERQSAYHSTGILAYAF